MREEGIGMELNEQERIQPKESGKFLFLNFILSTPALAEKDV